MSKLTTAQWEALKTTQLQNLRPYQLEQVMYNLSRFKYDRGSNSDVSVQSTIGTILATLGTSPDTNEP